MTSKKIDKSHSFHHRKIPSFFLFVFCLTMAPPGTKRSAPSSDFKRIKAKVGKRAPKPANYTDTSFQKASLHVTAQQEQQPQLGLDDVRSSRGRSLTTLAQQLGHATSSIRQSAAKGLLDIVSHKHDRSWQAHLSVVLPAIGHCLVDTETTVRTSGLSLWQALIDQTNEVSLLTPFWGIFVAFLSSALNSLDRCVRRDCRIVVESASRRLPALMAPHAAKLLPALMRLSEDSTFQYHSQVSSSSTTTVDSTKRNKNGRQVWLETLGALLASAEAEKSAVGDRSINDPTQKSIWNFTPGSVSKNSLFVTRPVTAVAIRPLQQWWHVQEGLGIETYRTAALAQSAKGLPGDVSTQVWTKLRDLFLEILESKNNSETLAVWAVALQALLSSSSSATLPESSERLVVQVQGLILSHEPAPALMDTWMLTLTQLSQALPTNVEASRRSSWIPRVVDFLLDYQDDDDAPEGARDGGDKHSIRWVILERFLDDTTILQSKPGRRVVDSLTQSWDERHLALVPKLYQVASEQDRLQILQRTMEFCINADPVKDETTVASVYEFLLDQIRNPQAIPSDLLAKFQPIWENEVVAHYKLESTQRLAFSLLVNLIDEEKLPDEILTALSRLCVKSIRGVEPCLAPAMVPMIQDAVFDMRRSLALPKYLAFLMEGTGVTTSLGDNETVKEEAVKRIMSYLLGSGVPNRKLLGMLWPLWHTWLTAKSVVPQRAALCFLAVLATDDASNTFLRGNLTVEAHHTVLNALTRALQHRDRSTSNQSWFHPLVVLLRNENWLWESMLQTIAKDLSNIEPVFFHNIRDIIGEAQILATLKEHSSFSDLQTAVHSLEEATKGGRLQAASRELTDCIKGLAATIPATTDANERITN